MGFELDVKDMDRHSVDLRLFLDKAKRRFQKAKMPDQFETIVTNVMNDDKPPSDMDSLTIREIGMEGSRRLVVFVMHQLSKCSEPEHLQIIQDALRKCLLETVRRDIQRSNQQAMCFFCTKSLTILPDSLESITNGTTNIPQNCNTNIHNQQQNGDYIYRPLNNIDEVPMETNGFRDHHLNHPRPATPAPTPAPEFNNEPGVPMETVPASQQTPPPEQDRVSQPAVASPELNKKQIMVKCQQQLAQPQIPGQLSNIHNNDSQSQDPGFIKLQMPQDSRSSDTNTQSSSGTSTDSTASIKSLKKELTSSNQSLTPRATPCPRIIKQETFLNRSANSFVQSQLQHNLDDSMFDSPRSRPLQIVTDSPSRTPTSHHNNHHRRPQSMLATNQLVSQQATTSQFATNRASGSIGLVSSYSSQPIIITPRGPTMPRQKRTQKRRNQMKPNTYY